MLWCSYFNELAKLCKYIVYIHVCYVNKCKKISICDNDDNDPNTFWFTVWGIQITL